MMYEYHEIERLTLKALTELIRSARGTCVTFSCKKLAKMAKLSTKPVTLTLVREVLEKLREKGLISIYRATSHGIKYIVTKDSPIWPLLKEDDPLDLKDLLDKIGDKHEEQE